MPLIENLSIPYLKWKKILIQCMLQLSIFKMDVEECSGNVVEKAGGHSRNMNTLAMGMLSIIIQYMNNFDFFFPIYYRTALLHSLYRSALSYG